MPKEPFPQRGEGMHPYFGYRICFLDANDSFLMAKAKLSPSKRIVLAAYR